MPEWMTGWGPWPVFAATLAVALVAAVIFVALVTLPLRFAARRGEWDPSLLGRLRRPFRVLVLIGALAAVAATSLPPAIAAAQAGILHALGILAILATGWLLAGVVGFFFARTLHRFPTEVADNRVARRVHTQIAILRRVTVAVIVVVTAGAVLLTFPGVSGIGASLLASAGVLSVVAGIAAQSTLGNVVAGIQLAFSDAIRVDDVVVVEGEWGRIQEITLTYIVVHIWDDRRLVLPSTYFTTTPFENWTRRGSEILGTIELDVDWQLPVDAMREHLAALLADEPLWDQRASSLQVTGATGDRVRVRIVVTAQDAPALWDLRCNVREEMVAWVRDRQPDALPRTRVVMVEPGTTRGAKSRASKGHEGMFSGSPEAEQRASAFTGSITLLPEGEPTDRAAR
jgi:small-conductance mechanosensitive channel